MVVSTDSEAGPDGKDGAVWPPLVWALRQGSDAGVTSPKSCFCDHIDLGIRELKARLSEAVERAAGGETIRITERGKPKALLVPLPGRGSIDRGIAEGWITQESDAPPVPVPALPSKRRVATVLDEDRGV